MPAVSPSIVKQATKVRARASRVAGLVARAAKTGRLALSIAYDVLAELTPVAASLDRLVEGTPVAVEAVQKAENVLDDLSAQPAPEANRDAPEAPAPEQVTPEASAAGSGPPPKRAKRKGRKASGRRVVDLPLDEVRTDPARFQPRGAAFSEESAHRVATEFDANLFEPIVVWEDPADGNTYVLAGHSRLAGFSRRPGVDAIPARYFSGSEAAAKRFAATENDKGTQLANHERAAYLRQMRASGETEAAISKEAKRLYKRDAATVNALSRLSASGEAMEALRLLPAGTDDARDAETMASGLGQLRVSHPALTDAHERELWAYLKENYKTKGRKHRSREAFATWINPRIERRMSFGQIDGPLNLAELPGVSRAEIEVDEAIQKAERELKQAEATLKKKRLGYVERGASGEKLDRALAADRGAVAVLTRDLLNLRQRRSGTIATLRASERGLFDNGPGSVPGLVAGQLSDVLAYLGRSVYLSTQTEGTYEYFKDEAGAMHLLYDPADGTLYLVPGTRVRVVGSIPDGVDDADVLAASSVQRRFHGFEPGARTFAVEWPDPDQEPVEAVGEATQIRYLSDKLGEAELPDGTKSWGARGRMRGFKHLFTESLPVHVIGTGERAVVAVSRVLVTDHGLIN